MDESLSLKIELWLDEFISGVGGDAFYEHKIAARFRVLPLYSDWTECRAIRPDGVIVCYMFDNSWNPEVTPPDLHVEDDVRWRHLALYQGAKKYPELSMLIPAKPIDAIDCPWCRGMGEIKHGNPDFPEIVCYCGGMGWLPADYAVEFPPKSKRGGA